MAIVTYPLNGVEYTAENAETYFCTRTSGVYAAEDNFVLSIVGAFEMSIGTGLAWIKDGTFSGKSVVSTEEVAIQVPIADGVLNRKDRIVLQFDKSKNASFIMLKQGEPASIAKAPSIVRDGTVYELGLYVIDVPAGSVGVTAQNVQNTMKDEDVCGLMRDAVTTAMPNHAPNHAIGGRDELSPEQIGAVAKPTEIALSGVVSVTIQDNAEYNFTDVTSLTITGNTYEAHGFVTFGSSTPSIYITNFVKSGGDDVADARASEIWEFSCDNGFILWKNWSA